MPGKVRKFLQLIEVSMQTRNIAKLIATAGVLVAGIMMNACTEKTAASVPPPSIPPEVAVLVVEPQPVTLTTELSGRISAQRRTRAMRSLTARLADTTAPCSRAQNCRCFYTTPGCTAQNTRPRA